MHWIFPTRHLIMSWYSQKETRYIFRFLKNQIQNLISMETQEKRVWNFQENVSQPQGLPRKYYERDFLISKYMTYQETPNNESPSSDYLEETYKKLMKNWRIRNDDSHHIELTWIIPSHCKNNRRWIILRRKSPNYKEYLWQALHEIWPNEKKINNKSIKGIKKVPSRKIPIQEYLHNLWEIQEQSKRIISYIRCLKRPTFYYCHNIISFKKDWHKRTRE